MRRLPAAGLLVCVAGLFLSACAYTGQRITDLQPTRTAPAPTPVITWEVENRFRLVAGERQEERFRKELSSYILEYLTWFPKEREIGWGANVLNTDLIHGARLPFYSKSGNILTHYDTRTGSYRCQRADSLTCLPGGGDWVAERGRSVRLSVTAWSGRQCEWTVGAAAPVTAPCVGYAIPVVLDRGVRIRVRLNGDPAAPLEDGRAVTSSDVVVWDVTRGCFRLFGTVHPGSQKATAGEAGCVKETDATHPDETWDPVHYKENIGDGTLAENGSIKDTSGVVHPNLFGHCAYAAARLGGGRCERPGKV